MEGANPEQGWKLEFDSRGLSLNRSDIPSPIDEKLGVGRFKPKAEPTSSLSSIVDVSTSFSPPEPVGSAREPHAGLTRPTARAESPYAFQLRTTAIGRAGALTSVTGAAPIVRDNRVELHHAHATEWYVNSAIGLEHGYSFEHAPQGEGGEVLIQLAVDGGLRARPDADGVLLTDASGTQRMRYHKLLVVDANNQKLDARLDVQADDRVQIAFDDTHATYPVVVDPLLVNEEAKLTVTGGGSSGDYFGYSVSIDGDTMVVGEIEFGNSQQGFAYVYVRSGTTWVQQAKLVAADGAAGDQFGGSVAVYGDTAVVGASVDSIGANFAQGSAYVYVRTGTAWNQQAKLTAADGAAKDFFGYSVSVFGDTVMAGVPQFQSSGLGSAYVYVRSGSTWSQQAKLMAADRAGFDFFGISVAVCGDTAVVGARDADIGSNADRGAAYVYVRSGSIWSQQAKLTAADGVEFDYFGQSVAMSGDTAVVAAWRDDIGPNSDQGSVYVYVRNGTTWSQQAKLIAMDGLADDLFGVSVSVSDNTAVVGSVLHDVGASTDQGAAYVFVRSGSIWSQQAKLTAADGAAGDQFGDSVAVSGDTVGVGVPGDDLGVGAFQGSAYVYRIAGIATDYGDAPDPSYPSLLANDGARHFLNGPKLGATIDAETDGQPNSGATGDDIAGIDDEDGVAFGSLVPGQSATVNVDVSGGPALLDAWIDFNRDGDWADAGERIFDHYIVPDGANDGLVFQVPAGAVAGSSYARVRLSSNGVTGVTGAAPDGEVEDEIVTITRRNTKLEVAPVAAVIVTQGLQLRIVINPTATLRQTADNAPIAGRAVNFAAGTTALCTAVTDANGVAKCQANLPNTLRGVLSLGYTGRFNGDATYNPSSGKGDVLGLKLF